jgi:hypothetical protein
MSTQPQQQEQKQVSRPAALIVAGVFLVVVGILGFIDSYLILASYIIWGWLIVGGIGLFTLISGVALMGGAAWAWGAASSLAILNLFIGFIELLGAFNYHYAILGWVGIGQAVGAGTLILSAVSLYLLYRKEVRSYYDQFYTEYYSGDYDPYFRYGTRY